MVNIGEIDRFPAQSGKTIAQMKTANELSRIGHSQLSQGLTQLWQVMNTCLSCGLTTEGTLPGGLNIKRRARALYDALHSERGLNQPAPHTVNGWIT